MEPLAIGSRISTFPFHRGSSTWSQSFGASAAVTAWELYAITSGVMYVPNHCARGSRAAAGTLSAHVGVYGSSSPSLDARAKISAGAPDQGGAWRVGFSRRGRVRN